MAKKNGRAGRSVLVPPALRRRLEELGGLMEKAFDETKHQRYPQGHPKGGQFMPKGGGGESASGESSRPRYDDVVAGEERQADYHEGLQGNLNRTEAQKTRDAVLDAAGHLERAREVLNRVNLRTDELPQEAATAIGEFAAQVADLYGNANKVVGEHVADIEVGDRLAAPEARLRELYPDQPDRVADIMNNIPPFADEASYFDWIATADEEALRAQFGE